MKRFPRVNCPQCGRSTAVMNDGVRLFEHEPCGRMHLFEPEVDNDGFWDPAVRPMPSSWSGTPEEWVASEVNRIVAQGNVPLFPNNPREEIRPIPSWWPGTEDDWKVNEQARIMAETTRSEYVMYEENGQPGERPAPFLSSAVVAVSEDFYPKKPRRCRWFGCKSTNGYSCKRCHSSTVPKTAKVI